MNLSKKRIALRRFYRLSTCIDVSGLLAFTLFLCHFLPLDVLRRTPASGGDTGSHFWPLYTLVNYGIPFHVFPVWNPANNGGEPQLLHYFPLPFFLMAGLSTVLPIGMSFNIGTLVPLFLLPISVYLCVRLMGLRFPAPLIATALSLPFLYNESYSMWGGNTLSNLAGQFAHGYALCLFCLATGVLCREIRRDYFPFFSTLLFSAVVLAHAYVAIVIPVVLIAIARWYSAAPAKTRALKCLTVAAWCPLLTAWFVVPLLTNQRWTTAMPMVWGIKELLHGTLPPVLYPVAGICLLCGAYIVFGKMLKPTRAALRAMSLIWAILGIVYLGLFFVFPKIGLVDIRAIPQIQLSICILAGCYAGAVLRMFSRSIALSGAPVVCAAALFWCNAHIEVLPHWFIYNYSGWSSKPGYPELSKLYTELHGSFSDPRVIYEHSDKNERGGSLRVFEMLPYFANRSTLESVYTQSTILAPATYLLQSELSETPSCPLLTYPCSKPNITAAKERLKLMGVEQLILVDPRTIKAAESAEYLRKQGTFGQWQLFATKDRPALAETFSASPGLSNNRGWKEEFYNWFRNYNGTQRFLVAGEFLEASRRAELEQGSGTSTWQTPVGTCHPKLDVSFNGLLLTTDCPGKAHLLKFAFHPSW